MRLRVILWMITLCIVLDYVGVPMTSLVAVLSVIGLAVSLAIQGTLSNLAGGIQVLLSKLQGGGLRGGRRHLRYGDGGRAGLY